MAFSLALAEQLRAQGWKVKIRDRERNEPPHLTILHRTRAWRYGLRSGRFLDAQPNPSEVPAEVVAAIERSMPLLRDTWDVMHPENPIGEHDVD